MARNSAGTYSLPAGTPKVAGTIISASVSNTIEGDIAQALTDSLDRNGKGGMLQPMRTIDGTVAAPAHSFTSETGSGWFRHAAGELRAAILGTYRLALTAAGAVVNGTLQAIGKITASAGADVNGTLAVIDDGGTSKKVTVDAPTGLAADYALTLPTALPGSTLPVTLTAAGSLATAQLVNSQQNFGTPSAATDVVIKSYVDLTTDTPTVASGDIATTQLRVTKSLGLVTVSGRLVFGPTTYAANATFLTLSTGYRPFTNFVTWARYVRADGTTVGLASLGVNTDGTLKFVTIARVDDWSGTTLLSTTDLATLHVAVSFHAA